MNKVHPNSNNTDKKFCHAASDLREILHLTEPFRKSNYELENIENGNYKNSYYKKETFEQTLQTTDDDYREIGIFHMELDL